MSPKAFRAASAVSQGRRTLRAPIPVRSDAKEGAVPSPAEPHHPTPTSRAQPVLGCTGQEEGAGEHISSVLPHHLPLCREKLRAAAGIAKPSPALCLSLVFANVTRVQE